MTHLRDTHAHLSSPSVRASLFAQRMGVCANWRERVPYYFRTARAHGSTDETSPARDPGARGLARARWSRGGAAASARESLKGVVHLGRRISICFWQAYMMIYVNPPKRRGSVHVSHTSLTDQASQRSESLDLIRQLSSTIGVSLRIHPLRPNMLKRLNTFVPCSTTTPWRPRGTSLSARTTPIRTGRPNACES